MLTKKDTDDLKKYLPIGLVIFVLTLVLFLVSHYYSTRDYNSISTSDAVIGRVIYAEKIDRSKKVMLENGKKFMLPDAYNDNYRPADLISIVGKGDYLEKQEGSDTLFVKKLNKDFIFVIGIHIKNP